MKQPVIIGFYGSSKSGKTTLITNLIQHFTKAGYRIASVKETDKKISIDQPKKDTWKHAQAGANLVVFSSQKETDYIFQHNQTTKAILDTITHFGQFDYVFIEGANDPLIQKIRIGTIKERPHTIAHYTGDIDKIITLIKNATTPQEKTNTEITLKVNGHTIPLTEFPATIINNTIQTMITSLKGVHTIHTIDLHISNSTTQ